MTGRFQFRQNSIQQFEFATINWDDKEKNYNERQKKKKFFHIDLYRTKLISIGQLSSWNRYGWLQILRSCINIFISVRFLNWPGPTAIDRSIMLSYLQKKKMNWRKIVGIIVVVVVHETLQWRHITTHHSFNLKIKSFKTKRERKKIDRREIIYFIEQIRFNILFQATQQKRSQNLQNNTYKNTLCFFLKKKNR